MGCGGILRPAGDAAPAPCQAGAPLRSSAACTWSGSATMRMATRGSPTTQRSTHRPQPTHFSRSTEARTPHGWRRPRAAVVDGHGLVDKGAHAVAHLAPHALQRDAQILLDDGDAHVHVGARLHVAQGSGGAGCDAGEVLAEAACVLARVDDGGSRCGARVAGRDVDGPVGTGFQAFAALDAAGHEVGFGLRPGGTQKTRPCRRWPGTRSVRPRWRRQSRL